VPATESPASVIDSHCHLADEAFEATLPEVIERARAAGVEGALCILDATNPAEAARSTRVALLWPSVRFAVGVHPHQAGVFAERLDDVGTHVRAAVAARAGTCAIGEIGLDYHYDFASPDVQREVFRRQILVASELDHPIVVHTREADDDTFAILTDDATPRVSGVFHCFTGNAATAQRAVDLGFYVSFSGIVTFRTADSIREAAAVVPADRLLIETDSPYLAPVPHRGKQNEPGWVVRVADVIAEVRGVSPAEVHAQTTAAYQALFRPHHTR
jgi:TatD DNase family protein